MSPGVIRHFGPMDPTGTHLLKAAMTQVQLSARTYHRILNLTRTIVVRPGWSRYRRRTWQRRSSIGRGCGCEFLIPELHRKQLAERSQSLKIAHLDRARLDGFGRVVYAAERFLEGLRALRQNQVGVRRLTFT